MTTPEQNISTGFHRRGLALSYLYRRSRQGPCTARNMENLLLAIVCECEQLGIEPMTDTTADTYTGVAPGHPD